MAGAPALRNKSESSALRFRSHQDALDFARNGVEDSNRRLAAQRLDLVEGYRNQELEIVIKWNANGGMGEKDFVFRAVPNRRGEDGNGAASALKIYAPGRDAERGESGVLPEITELVEGPKGVIPSFVWEETAKDRPNFIGQILGPPFCILEFASILGEGKGSLFGKMGAGSQSGGIANLIEGGAEGFDCLCGGVNTSYGDRSLQAHLVHQGIKINLSESAVWVLAVKGDQPLIEFSQVLICAREPSFWTEKRISARERHLVDHVVGMFPPDGGKSLKEFLFPDALHMFDNLNWDAMCAACSDELATVDREPPQKS